MVYNANLQAFRSAACTLYGDETSNLIYDCLEWAAGVAFHGRITAARPVILAPVEMAPYNRHLGWYGPMPGHRHGPIVVNRHVVQKVSDDWFAVPDKGRFHDLLVHEMTHAYQFEVIQARDGGDRSYDPHRGAHRCKSWYEAVSTAAPAVLGVEIPPDRWPIRKSVRRGGKITKGFAEGAVSEVQMTRWPDAIRSALMAGELALPPAG